MPMPTKPVSSIDAVFGLGENMSKTFVISKQRVAVLLMPHHIFTKEHGFDQLKRLREEINASLPNNNKLFKSYCTGESNYIIGATYIPRTRGLHFTRKKSMYFHTFSQYISSQTITADYCIVS